MVGRSVVRRGEVESLREINGRNSHNKASALLLLLMVVVFNSRRHHHKITVVIYHYITCYFKRDY